jgi:hypothetical protein
MEAQIELQERNTTGSLQTRLLVLPSQEFSHRLNSGDHCGYCISGREVIDVWPVYDVEHNLRSVRLIVSDVTPAFAESNFNYYFDHQSAVPLTRPALGTLFEQSTE